MLPANLYKYINLNSFYKKLLRTFLDTFLEMQAFKITLEKKFIEFSISQFYFLNF